MSADEPTPLDPLDDVVAAGLRLLLVGINPGVRSSLTGVHFAGPGNRFWPALHAAGITPVRLAPEQQRELLGLGVGITNLAARPSARADEVSRAELREGAASLEEKIARLGPRVVAVLGLTAYRIAFGRPGARAGRQPEPLAGAVLFVLPNPSGLNAHAQLADHARGLREAAEAAGLVLHLPQGAEPGRAAPGSAPDRA